MVSAAARAKARERAREERPLSVAMEEGRFDPARPHRTCGSCGAVFQATAEEVAAVREDAGDPPGYSSAFWEDRALGPILADHHGDTDQPACVPEAPNHDDERAVAYA